MSHCGAKSVTRWVQWEGYEISEEGYASSKVAECKYGNPCEI